MDEKEKIKEEKKFTTSAPQEISADFECPYRCCKMRKKNMIDIGVGLYALLYLTALNWWITIHFHLNEAKQINKQCSIDEKNMQVCAERVRSLTNKL